MKRWLGAALVLACLVQLAGCAPAAGKGTAAQGNATAASLPEYKPTPRPGREEAETALRLVPLELDGEREVVVSFSPDGEQLVSLDAGGPALRLYTRNGMAYEQQAEAGLAWVIDDLNNREEGRGSRLLHGLNTQTPDVAWAPGNRAVAFSVPQGLTPSDAGLYEWVFGEEIIDLTQSSPQNSSTLPAYSSDGSYVYFYHLAEGRQIARIPSGGGKAETICTIESGYVTSMTEHAGSLYYSLFYGGSPGQTYVACVEVDTGEDRVVLEGDSRSGTMLVKAVSPGSNWLLAYQAHNGMVKRDEEPDYYLLPLNASEEPVAISPQLSYYDEEYDAYSVNAAFSADGHRLLVADWLWQGRFAGLRVLDLVTGKTTPVLFSDELQSFCLPNSLADRYAVVDAHPGVSALRWLADDTLVVFADGQLYIAETAAALS